MVAKPSPNFVDTVKTVVLEKYCCFEGRARRSEYWYFCLANIVFSFVVTFFFMFIARVSGMPGLYYLSYIVSFALFLPSLGLAVRRLHDIGKSGWAYLMLFVPLVGWIILLVWFCQDSVPAANEYGPSPKYVDENVQ